MPLTTFCRTVPDAYSLEIDICNFNFIETSYYIVKTRKQCAHRFKKMDVIKQALDMTVC